MVLIQIHQWSQQGTRIVSRTQARRVLGISDSRRETFNQLLDEVFGWAEKQSFTEADLAELFKARVYLAARPGVHSRQTYKQLKSSKALLEAKFRQLGIDIDHKVERFLLHETRELA